jgi:hypothetical protein
VRCRPLPRAVLLCSNAQRRSGRRDKRPRSQARPMGMASPTRQHGSGQRTVDAQASSARCTSRHAHVPPLPLTNDSADRHGLQPVLVGPRSEGWREEDGGEAVRRRWPPK